MCIVSASWATQVMRWWGDGLALGVIGINSTLNSSHSTHFHQFRVSTLPISFSTFVSVSLFGFVVTFSADGQRQFAQVWMSPFHFPLSHTLEYCTEACAPVGTVEWTCLHFLFQEVTIWTILTLISGTSRGSLPILLLHFLIPGPRYPTCQLFLKNCSICLYVVCDWSSKSTSTSPPLHRHCGSAFSLFSLLTWPTPDLWPTDHYPSSPSRMFGCRLARGRISISHFTFRLALAEQGTSSLSPISPQFRPISANFALQLPILTESES